MIHSQNLPPRFCLNDARLLFIFVQYLEHRYHHNIRLFESFIAILKMVRDKTLF